MTDHEVITTNIGVVAPLFRQSPTDYGTLYTILKLTQGINTYVTGADSRTIITLDLDLYVRMSGLFSSN